MECEGLLDILNELHSEPEEDRSSELGSPGVKPIVMGNQGFIEEEISFFIENFRKKAVNSGLTEDSLIPIKSERD